MKQHGSIRIQTFFEPMFTENGYVVWNDNDADAWIIDPGFEPQPGQITEFLDSAGLRPAAIVLTHCHVDHIAGIHAIRSHYPDIPIWCPEGEEHMLADPMANLSATLMMSIVAPPANRRISPGETLSLGASRWDVLDVSGHSPAGLAYYCAASGVVLIGDALLHGSIGRYDFPGSDRERLLRNIVEHLLTLPEATALYAGHGPASTIGFEKRHNVTLRRELAS